MSTYNDICCIISTNHIYIYIYICIYILLLCPAYIRVPILRLRDFLTTDSFSKDHCANLGQPCARSFNKAQTILLTIMGPPQFPTYCIWFLTTLPQFNPTNIWKPQGRAGRRPRPLAGPRGVCCHYRNRFWCVLFPNKMDFLNNCGALTLSLRDLVRTLCLNIWRMRVRQIGTQDLHNSWEALCAYSCIRC